MPLKIAAKVDRVDEEYFKTHDRAAACRWARSSSSARSARIRKGSFSATPPALLFPIAWREPFGLVMIEAMACGTPVIAFENGSVPEVLEDGRHRLHRAQ